MSDMYFTSMYDRLKTGRRRSKNEGEIVSAYDAAIRASLQDVGGKTALQSGDSVSEASSSTTTVGLSALENASMGKSVKMSADMSLVNPDFWSKKKMFFLVEKWSKKNLCWSIF